MSKIDFPGMTPELQAYVDFDPSSVEGGHAELRRLRKLVDPKLFQAYNRARIDARFVNEKPDSRREHLSPSGKFKLVTSRFETGPNTWAYAQGKVYAMGSDIPIAVVNRNYGAFPFLFVEDHPNGHSYLICGEDYQGQTVIELDTGLRRDYLPEEAHDGGGFCWASYTFHADSKLLVVDGCYWGASYDFRFYDFSDPMSGWPLLELPDSENYITSGPKAPTFEADGTIHTYEPDFDDDDVVAAVKVWRREGLKLVLIREDVTEAEQERRTAEGGV